MQEEELQQRKWSPPELAVARVPTASRGEHEEREAPARVRAAWVFPPCGHHHGVGMTVSIMLGQRVQHVMRTRSAICVMVVLCLQAFMC